MFHKLVAIEPVSLIPSAEQELHQYAEEVTLYRDIPADDDEIARRIGDADAVLLSYTSRMGKNVIERCPNIRYIGMCCSLYSEESANVDIADALQFMGADIAYYSRTRKPDAEAVGMAYKPLAQLLTESKVVFTCLNKNVLLLGKDEFAQLGAGKVLFNTSIGPGFDSAALEQWLALPGTHFFCDTRAAAGPVSEGFFERENVHCANVSAGRTKQAFVLLSQKVLANIRTALGE